MLDLPAVLLAILMNSTVKEPARARVIEWPQNKWTFMVSVKRPGLTKFRLGGECGLGISFDRLANYAISTDSRLLRSNTSGHANSTTVNLFFRYRKWGLAYALGVWLGGVSLTSGGKKSKRAYALLATIALIVGVPCFYFSLQVGNVWLFNWIK